MPLYRLITLNHCSFSYISIVSSRSQYEPAPTEENVRSFKSYVANKQIALYKSQFNYLSFHLNEGIALKVSIMNCKIHSFGFHFDADFITENDSLSLLLIQIDRSFFQSRFRVWFGPENFFLLINLFNSNMSNVQLSTPNFNGRLHGPKVPCCCRLHTHRYRASRT